MLIARTVVADRGAVHRLRGVRQGDADRGGRFGLFGTGFCGANFCWGISRSFSLAKRNRSRRLQRGQGAASVASRNRREVGARVLINDRRATKTARISQRTVNQPLNIGLLQRMNPQQ